MILRMVGVSLKDLWKSSNINGLQAASKAFILIWTFKKWNESNRALYYHLHDDHFQFYLMFQYIEDLHQI